MAIIIRGSIIVAVCLAVVVLGYLVLRPRAAPQHVTTLDPSQRIADIDLPALSVVANSVHSFRAPEITLPEDAVWRVRGSFRTGHREGGSLVIAEAQIPRANRMVMSTNGIAGVIMKQNSECEFEIHLRQPKGLTPTGIIELRLGDDEHLAVCPFKIAP